MKKIFGKMPNGEEIYLYTLNDGEFTANIMTLGATLQAFKCFGTDIVGGFDTLEGYLLDKSFQGCIVGRVANRIENATVTIDGIKYSLTKNEGENMLHGGVGLHRKLWSVKEYNENSITLTVTSPDGDDGFPGNLSITVTYTLRDGALMINYKAVSDKKTPIALTNHAFFNIDGFGGDILGQNLKIYANQYTEVSENLIPTGKRIEVFGTQFDFNNMHKIGDRIFDGIPGYDHNYVLSPIKSDIFGGKAIPLAAEAENGKIRLSVYTDQPCAQFYSGIYLGNEPLFKGNTKIVKCGAFCLEAQTEPNCVNHGLAIYDAGEEYTQTTVYKVEKI